MQQFMFEVKGFCICFCFWKDGDLFFSNVSIKNDVLPVDIAGSRG